MDTLKLNKSQMEKIEFYCKEEMKELKKIVDPLLRSHNISKMSWDDMYDRALETLLYCARNYDESKSQFNTYLQGSIHRKFLNFIRDMMIYRKCNVIDEEEITLPNGEVKKHKIIEKNVSFDSTDSEGNALKDTIKSDFDLENEIIRKIEGNFANEKIISYLKKLSKREREVAILLSEGYKKYEILDELHITHAEFTERLRGMKKYEKVSVLF